MSAADSATPKTSLADWMKNKPGATLPGKAYVEPKSPPKATSKPTNGTDEAFFVPASAVDREWDLGRYLVRIVEAEDYTAQSSGNKSFKVNYVGLTGTMKNAGLDDYWPKAGKGLRKTHKAANAVDLVDVEGNISIPGGAQQLVGRELWIEIERVIESYNDPETGEKKSRPRNKIGFTGYHHKSAFDVPADNDPFSEGQPLPATGTLTIKNAAGTNVTAVAETGEIVGVEPGADDAPAFT